MAGDNTVAVNGTPLAPQPSRFIPHPPRGSNPRGLNGLFNPSAPAFGWSFELVYGSEELTDEASWQAAVAAFGSPGSAPVELSYKDFNGNTQYHMVALLEEIVAPFHWGTLPERFGFMVYEVGTVGSGS